MNTPTVVFLIALGLAQSAANHLSCHQIRAFVDGHNSRRLRLAQGKVPGQPGADNMGYMIWDEELAAKASQWASRHKFEHNPNRKLNSGRFSTGENIYLISSTDLNFKFDPNSAMSSWFDEYKIYKFGSLKREDFRHYSKQIGHYTQMVWAKSTHLGCGISDIVIGGYKKYYVVCNYGPSGNILGQTPYKPSNSGRRKLSYGSYKTSRVYGNYCPK